MATSRRSRLAVRAVAVGGLLGLGVVTTIPALGAGYASPPDLSTCPPEALAGGSGGQAVAGYTLSALAAGFRYQVNSPGLLPVGDAREGNVTEADVPFARTTVSDGPLVDSLASGAYPGDTFAHLGTAIETFGGPPTPNDPVLAEAAYPPSPGHGSEATFGPPNGPGPGAGSAHATADAPGGAAQSSVASSAFGSPGAPPAARGGLSETTTVIRLGSSCVDTAGASSTGAIDIAGLIHIGGVTGSASARSDGSAAHPRASLTVGDVTVGGLNGFVDREGIHLTGRQPAGSGVVARAQSLLEQTLRTAGVTVKLIGPRVATAGAQATADSGGIDITIDSKLPPLGVPGTPALSLPGLAAVPLGTPGAPLHIEVVYGAARALVNATAVPGDADTIPPFRLGGATTRSGDLRIGSPPGTTPSPAAVIAPGASRSAASGPGASPAPGSASSAEVLVADSAGQPAAGSPVPMAWAIIGILGVVVAVGPMLGYARWQLLEGRI